MYIVATLICIVLYCIVLYCNVLYCIVLYCIVLYCIVLYCTVLYCIVLYCIVSYLLSKPTEDEPPITGKGKQIITESLNLQIKTKYMLRIKIGKDKL